LRALRDFSPDAVVSVVVHPLDAKTPAPLFAKFLVAMTTESGGAAPSICEDCVSEESSSSYDGESDESSWEMNTPDRFQAADFFSEALWWSVAVI